METSKDKQALNTECKTKPDISYPTKWQYKIIGRVPSELLSCIKEVMGGREHTCSKGNSSKTGKFTTYNTTCTVTSEEERNKIFKYFEESESVKMVI